tara:strand:+ start:795 stop:980 length:186 start_codon:yes stop_codon:yes gene_type:complete
MPRIVFYPESFSSGITHVMEGDEVGKRAKKLQDMFKLKACLQVIILVNKVQRIEKLARIVL